MKTLRSIFFLSLCLLLSVAGYAGDKASFLKKQFTARDGYQLNYRVLYPRDYNPAQKYPVILFLHGAGERGSDNEAQLIHGGDMFASFENQTKYPAIIIAPQCPAEKTWSEYKGLNAMINTESRLALKVCQTLQICSTTDRGGSGKQVRVTHHDIERAHTSH